MQRLRTCKPVRRQCLQSVTASLAKDVKTVYIIRMNRASVVRRELGLSGAVSPAASRCSAEWRRPAVVQLDIVIFWDTISVSSY